MVRKATAADVASVEVEIDRPVDRSGKENRNRTNAGTVSVTGSGGSAEVIANGSEGNWFLEGTSIVAVGTDLALGALQVVVQVRDGSDNMVVEQELDPAAGSHVPMGGQIVKPGWDVHLVVTQGDANSYTIRAKPLFRKPDPDSGSGGGGGGSETSATIYEGWERPSPLSDYSGNPGQFTTTTGTVYYGDVALHYDSGATDTRHRIVSTTLDELPSPPFVIDARVRSDTSDVSSAGGDEIGISFGAADTDNLFEATLVPERSNFRLNEIDGGGLTYIANESSGLGTRTYPGDEWWRIEIEVDEGEDDPITCTLYDADGEELGTRTATGNYSMHGQGLGVTAQKSDSANNHFVDYTREV